MVLAVNRLSGFGGKKGYTSPLDIANLVLWLDANDAATLFQEDTASTSATANNDPIGYWGDKSGNNNHAKQTSSGARPLLKTSSINGKNSIEADSTDDVLNLTSALAITADLSLYCVGTRATSSTLSPIGHTTTQSSVATVFNTNICYIQFGSNYVQVNYTGSTGTIVCRWTRDGSNNCRFAATGMTDAAMSGGTGSSGTQTSNTVLARPGNSQWNGSGNKMGEIIIYSRKLITVEDAFIQSYISNKWGASL